MNKSIVGAFCIVAAAVLTAVMVSGAATAWLPGVALLVVIAVLRWRIDHPADDTVPGEGSDDLAESLRRWVSRTEITIHWAESTRTNWDRRLRPILARQFEMAAGQRRAADPAAYDATGLMHFGPELWSWMAPDNVARSGESQPGPGRGVLDRILQRLEQL